MPLPRAAPLPAETLGGWFPVVRGNGRADRRVLGGDFLPHTYPEIAGPFHCGRASPASAPPLRARAPRALLGDRALELFKLYAIAPRAARGITFPARKRKGPGRNVPGPFVGCLLSLAGHLVNRSGKRRANFVSPAGNRPHCLLEFAECNFQSLFGGPD